MEYFIFNNINSKDLNIVVKKLPPIVRAAQRINTITIDGRSGSLHEIEDNYDSHTAQIECILLQNADINVIKKLYQGSGKIIFSSNLDVFYNVTILNKIDFTKYMTILREFPLEIEIQPIAYSITEQNYIIENESFGNITIDSTYKNYPLLRVYGNGSITCNNRTIIVSDNEDYIDIDCELMNAFKDTLNKNNNVNGLEKPLYLDVGNNLIEIIGITKLEVKYKEAWL